jgi:hypothetical protein
LFTFSSSFDLHQTERCVDGKENDFDLEKMSRHFYVARQENISMHWQIARFIKHIMLHIKCFIIFYIIIIIT